MTESGVDWDVSAEAWIASLGEAGDYGRRHVLDAPMLALATAADPGVAQALDVGCGEGRFCRMLAARGIAAIGVDPTAALIAAARARDPAGDYRIGRAEALDFGDDAFDLVISYVALVDIPDAAAAIAEMARVLRPGGRLLIANVNGFVTAGQGLGWRVQTDGTTRFCLDHYLEERWNWEEWQGIRVRNWHRPLSTYMALLLGQGLQLTHFDEPAPTGGDPARGARYVRAPWFVVTAWRKPGGGRAP